MDGITITQVIDEGDLFLNYEDYPVDLPENEISEHDIAQMIELNEGPSRQSSPAEEVINEVGSPEFKHIEKLTSSTVHPSLKRRTYTKRADKEKDEKKSESRTYTKRADKEKDEKKSEVTIKRENKLSAMKIEIKQARQVLDVYKVKIRNHKKKLNSIILEEKMYERKVARMKKKWAKLQKMCLRQEVIQRNPGAVRRGRPRTRIPKEFADGSVTETEERENEAQAQYTTLAVARSGRPRKLRPSFQKFILKSSKEVIWTEPLNQAPSPSPRAEPLSTPSRKVVYNGEKRPRGRPKKIPLTGTLIKFDGNEESALNVIEEDNVEVDVIEDGAVYDSILEDVEGLKETIVEEVVAQEGEIMDVDQIVNKTGLSEEKEDQREVLEEVVASASVFESPTNVEHDENKECGDGLEQNNKTEQIASEPLKEKDLNNKLERKVMLVLKKCHLPQGETLYLNSKSEAEEKAVEAKVDIKSPEKCEPVKERRRSRRGVLLTSPEESLSVEAPPSTDENIAVDLQAKDENVKFDDEESAITEEESLGSNDIKSQEVPLRRRSAREVKFTPKLAEIMQDSKRSESAGLDPYPNLMLRGTSACAAVEVPVLKNALQNKVDNLMELYSCPFNPGDLVWLNLGQPPLWPSIVIQDPFKSDEYCEIRTRSGVNAGVFVHVQLLQERGRRAWVPLSALQPFHGQGEQFCPPEESKTSKWNIAVKSAESLLAKPESRRISAIRRSQPMERYGDCSLEESVTANISDILGEIDQNPEVKLEESTPSRRNSAKLYHASDVDEATRKVNIRHRSRQRKVTNNTEVIPKIENEDVKSSSLNCGNDAPVEGADLNVSVVLEKPANDLVLTKGVKSANAKKSRRRTKKEIEGDCISNSGPGETGVEVKAESISLTPSKVKVHEQNGIHSIESSSLNVKKSRKKTPIEPDVTLQNDISSSELAENDKSVNKSTSKIRKSRKKTNVEPENKINGLEVTEVEKSASITTGKLKTSRKRGQTELETELTVFNENEKPVEMNTLVTPKVKRSRKKAVIAGSGLENGSTVMENGLEMSVVDTDEIKTSNSRKRKSNAKVTSENVGVTDKHVSDQLNGVEPNKVGADKKVTVGEKNRKRKGSPLQASIVAKKVRGDNAAIAIMTRNDPPSRASSVLSDVSSGSTRSQDGAGKTSKFSKGTLFKGLPAKKICEICLDEEKEATHRCAGACLGFYHPACQGPTPVEPNTEGWVCQYCRDVRNPCFVCKSAAGTRQMCLSGGCGKFYHSKCLKLFPQTKFNHGKRKDMGLQSDPEDSDPLPLEITSCARHTCHTCSSDNPANASSVPLNKLVHCVKCPTSYHQTDWCLPAGTEILTPTTILCGKHFEPGNSRVVHHVNINWCFLCARGGELICCDFCPASIHAECQKLKPPEGSYACEECESGRFPLYGEIVWVKLGNFRWWPSKVLFPHEIPLNMQKAPRRKCEFVIQFYGTHDYQWTNRGRVYLYLEDDRQKPLRHQKRLEKSFQRALDEAAAEFAARKMTLAARNHTLTAKPAFYEKIRANKYTKGLGAGAQVEPPVCDCSPNDEEPCGPLTNCLNRVLLIECHPNLCRAGERCANQRFQKRQYCSLQPIRTSDRGWGLETKNDIVRGQFVIEYIGEVISDEEMAKRRSFKMTMKDPNFYFFRLDANRVIDAGPMGNISRFANHSCSPNCEPQKWTVNGCTRLGLFALEDIPKGTELTFNYGFDSVCCKNICCCGSESCSGIIGEQIKTKKGEREAIKGKKKSKAKAKQQRAKKAAEDGANKSGCHKCGAEGGELICLSDGCTTMSHVACVGEGYKVEDEWFCSKHVCSLCSNRTKRYCQTCLTAFCSRHLLKNLVTSDTGDLYCLQHIPTLVKLPKRLSRLQRQASDNESETTSINGDINDDIQKCVADALESIISASEDAAAASPENHAAIPEDIPGSPEDAITDDLIPAMATDLHENLVLIGLDGEEVVVTPDSVSDLESSPSKKAKRRTNLPRSKIYSSPAL